MASGPFTLAQLAEIVGTTVNILHGYRDAGLLQSPRRSRGRGGEYAYHQEHVDRVRVIRRALGYGFTVEDIKRFVAVNALLTCGDVHDIAARRLQAMRDEQGPDDPAVVALESLVSKCAGGSRSDCHLLAVLAGETTVRAAPRERRRD